MGFTESFRAVVGVEGGYSKNAADRGGPTKFGITELVARANGYTDSMQGLPLLVAQEIYKKQYWDLLSLDAVATMSGELAGALFDTGVNMGVATAGKFLQRALNVLNRRATLYPDLTVDGVIGPVTVANLRLLVQRRGVDGLEVLLKALNCLKGCRYIEIAEQNPSQEEFEFGWLHTRVR